MAMGMGQPRLRTIPDPPDEIERLTRDLQESDARFRDVIERNADAIVVVDREGVVRFANAMAERLFDRGRGDLVGSRFGFPAIAGETTEVDVIARGVVRVAEMRVVESRWDGDLAYLASLRDVTERKLAERSARTLIAAEEVGRRQRFLLDLSASLSASLDYERILQTLARRCVPTVADWTLVFCLDDDGSVGHVEIGHECAESATAARELQARLLERGTSHPLIELFKTTSPLVLPRVEDDALAALAGDQRELALARELGVASAILVPMIARDRRLGAIAFVGSTSDRSYDANDLALAQDVAARAALAIDNATLYRDAQRANEARSNLLAVVSHDLRTPLSAIIGFADLLADGIPAPLPEGSRDHVERIRRSARHLLYLMNEFLTFSRLDAGRETMHERDGVDVCEIADDVAAVMEPMSAQRGLRFHVQSPSEPVRLRTDPDKLRQILLNVAGNAVKYTPSGEVSLRIAESVDQVVITVADTGIGIERADLKRIFEPFWQADAAQRSTDGGTGLGLSIVRRMLELLGGRIAVDSVVGRGTTVTLGLPRSRS